MGLAKGVCFSVDQLLFYTSTHKCSIKSPNHPPLCVLDFQQNEHNRHTHIIWLLRCVVGLRYWTKEEKSKTEDFSINVFCTDQIYYSLTMICFESCPAYVRYLSTPSLPFRKVQTWWLISLWLKNTLASILQNLHTTSNRWHNISKIE